MAHILVLYSTSDGQTRKIASFVAEQLREKAHSVDVMDVSAFEGSLVTDGYDGVIVGASVHSGQHQAAARSFAQRHRNVLRRRPSAFFSVSLAVLDDEHHEEADRYVSDFLAETGWSPDEVATVAGALRYTQYGFLKRFLMKQISKRSGRPTDTSRDFEFTDWKQVARFADRFRQQVESAAANRTPSPQSTSPS